MLFQEDEGRDLQDRGTVGGHTDTFPLQSCQSDEKIIALEEKLSEQDRQTKEMFKQFKAEIIGKLEGQEERAGNQEARIARLEEIIVKLEGRVIKQDERISEQDLKLSKQDIIRIVGQGELFVEQDTTQEQNSVLL